MTPHRPQVETDHPAGSPTLAQDPRQPRPSCFAFLAPPQSGDEIGRLGGFRVLELLGEGGMGMVFRAEDPALGRQVALKVMKPEYARHDQGRKRFLREARAVAAIKHDHVVPIYQVVEDDSVPFFAMPLLQGESLADRLRRPSRLTAEEAVRIAREAAEGLAAAHAAGLVHRDVKPSNLWLERRPDGGERVLVLDFGLVLSMDDEERLTGPDLAVGTPGYMSPEQARAETLDGRTDLFSLGCVLYRMCAGRPPFQAVPPTPAPAPQPTPDMPSPQAVAVCVPVALSDLVMRLLSKDPAGRPASARETANALREIERAIHTAPTAPLPVVPPPLPSPIPPDPEPPPPPRRRWLLVLVAAPVLAAGLGGWWLWAHQAAPHFQGDFTLAVAGRDGTHFLGGPEAVSVKPDDMLTFKAALTDGPPAYFYLIHIDSTGAAAPYYPPGWRTWAAAPPGEKLINLPKPLGFKIHNSPSGLEAFVWLVRAEPLAAADGAKLGALFSPPALQWGQPAEVKGRRAVWWKNGRYDSTRGALEDADAGAAADPISQLDQALSAVHSQRLADFSQAVCYPFEGD